MAADLFEQLADAPVPPVPERLNDEVHQRLNKRLLLEHLVDFGLGAMTCALVHFVKAVLGVFGFTLSGRFSEDRGRRKPPA